jgi:nucleoside-diphosphate-sugar epimerase
MERLAAAGHSAVGMVRSRDSEASLAGAGAQAVIGDALDRNSVMAAVERVRPDVIINELTSLPKHYTPTEMEAATERDARVRMEGNKNLIAAALQTGVRRFIVQSSGFWYAPGEGLADESESLAINASPAVAAGSQRYVELEAMALGRTEFAGTALRYGFFYGPGTWYIPEGDIGEQVRQQQVPIIGHGQGVSNWVHIDDAADATVRSLGGEPGIYNIVDDDPSEQRVWLTAFARFCGAPDPPRVSEQQALQAAGADAVYYATRLRGASNGKAKRLLGFRPRPLEWLAVAGSPH